MNTSDSILTVWTQTIQEETTSVYGNVVLVGSYKVRQLNLEAPFSMVKLNVSKMCVHHHGIAHLQEL